MTDTFRSLCAELLENFDNLRDSSEGVAGLHCNGDLAPWDELSESGEYPWLASFDRARALLAQPVAEGPSADEWDALVARAWDQYETVGHQGERFMYDSDFCNALDLVQRELARYAHPTPQPPALADVHYEWELQDAGGDWQAGGSANSLDDVEREGAHYLQQYSQDGPHKLIIRQHCTETINEIANG